MYVAVAILSACLAEEAVSENFSISSSSLGKNAEFFGISCHNTAYLDFVFELFLCRLMHLRN